MNILFITIFSCAFAAGSPVSSDSVFARQLSAIGNGSALKIPSAAQAKTAPEAAPARKVEGIGFAHSGSPFDIPYFSLYDLAGLIKEIGGTHYRPHCPLNEVAPKISKEDMERLKLAAKDSALLDRMIDELSKNGRWGRMDVLVDAFASKGIKLVMVGGSGYRKEAPLYVKEDGSTEQISPARVGADVYIAFVKWVVGAGARRYADKVFVWQVENEINTAFSHIIGNWRIKDKIWTDAAFQRRLVRELSDIVHKQGPQLKTTHNYATTVSGWQECAKAGVEDGLDIVGLDLYAHYYSGYGINGDAMARIVADGKKISGGKPVWILETGYARAPQFPNGFSPQKQAVYFRTLFDSCYAAGADVILAFGWFWNPKGWFTDNGETPFPGSPMSAEPYWSPIELCPDGSGGQKPFFNPAWGEFKNAAAKWVRR